MLSKISLTIKLKWYFLHLQRRLNFIFCTYTRGSTQTIRIQPKIYGCTHYKHWLHASSEHVHLYGHPMQYKQNRMSVCHLLCKQAIPLTVNAHFCLRWPKSKINQEQHVVLKEKRYCKMRSCSCRSCSSDFKDCYLMTEVFYIKHKQ